MTKKATQDDSTPLYDANDVAVIGMACRFPGARNVDEFWRNLVEGNESLTQLSDEELAESGVSEAERQDPNYISAGMFLEDMECFDAGFFGISPQDARIMDPQHRHFLECAWEAFEEAGYIPNAIEGSVGVYAGSGHNAYLPYNILTNPELKEQLGFFLLRHTGNDKDFLSTRASYIFNWQGPSLNVQTACSTSLVAIHLAAQSLLNGECDMALAGGVTIELPHRQGYLYKENEILSKDGHCRPFEASSGGTIFGSGVGCVVLKRLEDALADGDQVHAVIKSSAVNNDGSAKVSYLAPSVDGQAFAASDALEVAEIDPQSVTYIECHGTGTALGDPIEVAALTQAYGAGNPRTQYCALGSVKSNIGHTDTAAGVAGFIKSVLCLKHRKLVPTLHFDVPNPQIDFTNSPFYVNDRLRDWHSISPRRAAVSSLGVGGTNAHLILEEAPEIDGSFAAEEPDRFEVLALSARTPSALDEYAKKYTSFLGMETKSGVRLRQICAAALYTRSRFDQRCVCVSNSASNMRDVLKGSKHPMYASHKASEKTRLGFLFAGGGVQYPNMGRDLYDSEPVYRQVLDQCLVQAEAILDFDLRSLLFSDPDSQNHAAANDALQRPSRALPALFVTQYAQAKLWQSWGIEPAMMIGHSMGEYTAAALAGVFDMPSALAIVAKRGELFDALPDGAMLSVMMREDELRSQLPEGLSIAAQNSQSLNVVSGPVAEIEAFQSALEKADVQCRRVKINVAAHSPILEPILDTFESFLRGIKYHPPKIKIASNLTGSWLSDEEAMSASYWVRHLRETVKFADGLNLLLDSGDGVSPVLLEVGPGNTLASLARQHSRLPKDVLVATSMRHPQEEVHDQAYMRLALGKLWCAGVDVDWVKMYKPINQKISLPTYPFEKHRYWIEPGNRIDSSSRIQDLKDWFYVKSLIPSPLAIIPSKEPAPDFFLLASGSEFVDSLARGVNFSAVSTDFDKLVPRIRQSKRPVLCYVLTDDHWCMDSPEIFSRFKVFFQFSKALCEAGIDGLVLSIISSDAMTVNGSEGSDPIVAAIAGASRVLAHECAGLVGVKMLDLDARAVANSGALQRELSDTQNRFETIVYRYGVRYRESFHHAELPEIDGDRKIPHFRGEPVCVVSGGLGGLGLILAEQLSVIPNMKLVLLTHRDFADPSEWSELSGKPGRVGQQARRLLTISANGAEIYLFTVDMANEEQVLECFAKIEAEIGRPVGVFHAAGSIDDQLLSMKTWAASESVLAPKVLGARNLAKACEDKDIEAFVLYSSVSSQTGMVGQFDYAAANAYLDAYAGLLRSQGLPAISINWSAWQEVGMAAELASGCRVMGASFQEFASELRDNAVQIYLDTQRWWIDEHRTKSGMALMPGTGFLNHLVTACAIFTDSSLTAGRALVLKDCFFAAPLVFRENQQKVMSIHFTQLSEGDAQGTDGRYVFQVFSALSPAAAEYGDYENEHMGGSFFWLTEPAKQIDLNAIKEACVLSCEDFHGSKEHVHMQFGARWGVKHRVFIGNKECLAELRLPEAFHRDLSSDCMLHPAVLDMATGIAHQLVSDYDLKRDFFVPVAYGELCIYRPLTACCWSHARWLRDEGDESFFDVTIADNLGSVLVEIRSFCAKRMAANALDDLSLQPVGDLELDLSKAIRPAQGQEALSRILSYDNPSQIIVSPQPFDLILKERQRTALADNQESQLERSGLDSEFAGAETVVQQKLIDLWSKALGVDGLGIHDNFFELGGHSLLLTQVAMRAKKVLRKQVALSKMFERPTIAGWAEHAQYDQVLAGDMQGKETQISGGDMGLEQDNPMVDIEPVLRDGSSFTAPLSPTQASLWYVNELSSGSAYHIPVAIRLKGQLNEEALRSAVEALQARHEILRTTYSEEDDGMVQHVHTCLPVVFRHQAVVPGEMASAVQFEVEQPFDLRNDSPMRVTLFNQGDFEAVLLLNFHHIALDHLALLVLIKEIEQLYSGHCQGKSVTLQSPPFQYADYSVWVNQYLKASQEKIQAKVAVWADRLAGFSGFLDLPLDRARPRSPTGKGKQHLFAFSPELSDKLSIFSRSQSVSVFQTVLSTLNVLLHRYSGQDDIIVGTPFANRGESEALQAVIGCFINTLPIASRMSESASFLSLLEQVKKVMFEAYDNQDVPLNLITDAAHISRDPSYNPLFQVGFVFQAPPGSLKLEGLVCEPLPVHSGGAMYDLHFWLWDDAEQGDEKMSGLVWYNSDVLDEATVQRMVDQWQSLIASLIQYPESDYRSLPMLTEEEVQTVSSANSTASNVDLAVSLPELFSKQASECPDSIAVACDEQSLSYSELEHRSTMLACYLLAQGVSPGDRIGVSIERSVDMLVSVLAVMKAGACYVPMDPAYPKERLGYMLEQAGIGLILSSEEAADELDYFDGRIVKLDTNWDDIESVRLQTLPTVHPEDIAYIIFTSGSTGLPKGVQVPHRGVTNFLHSMASTPGIKRNDRLLAITTLSFDIAVLELYLPLIIGARVVIATEDEAIDGHELKALIETHQISVMQATPSTWRTLLAAGWKGDLKVLCGGEPFPIDLARQLSEGCSEVWNMYGPTETTVWSMCRRVNIHKPNVIGYPIANTQCFVLNSQGQEQPTGVVGELYIGGDGVTHGYLNRDDLTEKAFVRIDGLEGTLYRTGDAVKRLSGGEIEYVQRLDNQVKVRGYRIELGEIEAIILKHSLVAECAVLVREYSEVDKRIVAYVKFSEAGQSLTMSELRRYMRGFLPDYMIPQQLVEMLEMPLTQNGKIDRKALPDETVGTFEQDSTDLAPKTAMQKALAEIWKDLTGHENIRLNHYFFDVGGHSLLSMQLIHLLEARFSYRFRPADMVLNTLEQLAVILQEQLPETEIRENADRPVEITKSTMESSDTNPKKSFFSRIFGGKG